MDVPSSIVVRLTLLPVPETKQLTLEEMDLLFGTSNVAAADQERMAQINVEIGLDRRVREGSLAENKEASEAPEKMVEAKELKA
jgi:hypothetical protein